MADTKVSALTELSTLSATDHIYVSPLVTGTRRDRRMTGANLAAGVMSLSAVQVDATNNKVTVLTGHNASDSDICTITAAGTAGFPNLIGSTGKPVASDFTPAAWVDDSGYVANSAEVSGILSGYDHVANCLAGTICGGGHNFLRYTIEGHSFIGGGSYNIIYGGRSFIGAGRRNSISGGVGCNFNAICGGDDNEISGATLGSFIGSGLSNEVSGDYASIPTGNACLASGDYSRSSGNTATASGSYATAHGLSCTASGTHSHAVGATVVAANNYASAFGADALSQCDTSTTLARVKLAEVADAQSATVVMAVRTTNATLANMSAASSARFFELPDDKVSTGTCKVLLTAMRDGSADANNDGDYTQVAYVGEFGFYWNGTNGFLFNASTQTSVAAAPTLDLTALSANTNNDFTPGAAPHVAINDGSLRLKVTGIASTTINWVARLDIVVTRVS